MNTVLDYLKALEFTISDTDPKRGQCPNPLAYRIATVWKYSLLYLVDHQKLNLKDSKDRFIEYTERYTPADHYKVANAYLKSIGKPLLAFEMTQK